MTIGSRNGLNRQGLRRRNLGAGGTLVLAVIGLLGIAARPACAHHGVASLGVAGLKGPGAPIETSSSATLPPGSFLAYMKLDYASFETYTPARDDEGDYNAFWMYGLGFGARSWLSLYLFAPFYTKKTEDNSYTSSGFADLSLMAVAGFRLDGMRFGLVPANESLDDLEDWHFTLYGGATLPTGKANLRDADGNIDPGMSLGFGNPAYTAGATATKQFGRLSWVTDVSFIGFSEYEYADGQRTRFGDEFRVNVALPVRLLAAGDAELRLDAVLEANYLSLGRDESGGVGEDATGGRMLYLVPGLRLYAGQTSLGLGLKLPGWTDLNEEAEQQGAEGKEAYRAILTFSTLI
ncbi:MAG: transporter [Candidatus Eisenbacteria bacterium]|nr:transporter [Candidatus Eisenbacteria bacterium]